MSIKDKLTKLNQEEIEVKEENLIEPEEVIEQKYSQTNFNSDNKLCLGLIFEGNRHRDFSVRKFDGDAKAELFRTDVRENPAKALTFMLAKCIVQIGPYYNPLLENSNSKLSELEWLSVIKHLSIVDSEHALLEIIKKTTNKSTSINSRCENIKCNKQIEIRMSPQDIPVIYPDCDLEIDNAGKYLIRLYSEDPYIDSVLAIPDRMIAEYVGGLDEDNEIRLQYTLWNLMCRKLNGKTYGGHGAQGEFEKLRDEEIEEFMQLWALELPGPQKMYVEECPYCQDDIVFRCAVDSFLSQDQKIFKKKLKDRLKKKRKR